MYKRQGIHRAVQRGLRLFRFRQLFQPADRRLVVARFQRRVAQRRRHIRKFLRRILIVARREQLFRRLFKLACRKGVRARRVAADLSARLRVFVEMCIRDRAMLVLTPRVNGSPATASVLF